jgi:hypothetical protein
MAAAAARVPTALADEIHEGNPPWKKDREPAGVLLPGERSTWVLFPMDENDTIHW